MKRSVLIVVSWGITGVLVGILVVRIAGGSRAGRVDYRTNSASRVVIDEAFKAGLANWEYWECTGIETQQIRWGSDGNMGWVRIENPGGKLIGIKRVAKVVSGEVYRLSAAARSVATNASDVLFGGRVAVFLPPQAERELVWMSEYNRWWRKELVFTNEVTGTAVVYVHLGYGKVATTGEFSSIRLERIGRPPR